MLSKCARVSRALIRSSSVRSIRFVPSNLSSRTFASSNSHNEPETIDAAAPSESLSGSTERHSFQAETKRLLEIVAKSLYTDKEIFIRELISNASDACEKLRYRQTANEDIIEEDLELRINISTDEERGTMTIRDTGIGMSREELIENLGTIAHSGSKKFVSNLSSEGSSDGIIGQFGVGFYSVFMVADRVEVFSRPAAGGPAHYWASNGDGSYELGEAENVERGTKIVLHLRNDCKNFSKKKTVQRIAKKHSSFVSFPIQVDDQMLSTIGAVWLKPTNEVDDTAHEEFYKYVSQAYDLPYYRLHFHSDVPLSIHALFYFPERHLEKYGLGRMDPGVNLYSRKILIQANSESILPGWLRFVKGVVDSEDIPLNISRENMQDTQLISRIRKVLTRKIIRHLEEMSNENPKRFFAWYKEFGMFIREGVATDVDNRNEVARLLRYDSSTQSGPTSLDAYISRMPPSQKNIYYLFAPTKSQAEESPYMEAFKENNIEVFYVYSQVDEMVIQSLRQFENRDIKCAEADDVEVNRKDESIDEESSKDLAKWMEKVLGDKVKSVSPTRRALSSPAIVVDQESSSSRRMMGMMEMSGESMPLPAQKLEINPNHSILQSLYALKDTNSTLAPLIAEQILDNALITAGLLQQPRSMVGRINDLMTVALENTKAPAKRGRKPKIEKADVDSISDGQ